MKKNVNNNFKKDSPRRVGVYAPFLLSVNNVGLCGLFYLTFRKRRGKESEWRGVNFMKNLENDLWLQVPFQFCA